MRPGLRSFLLFCCLALAGLPGLALALAELQPEEIAVDYRDGQYVASLGFRVAVPPAVALDVLTDFDHMAEVVPNLSASRILARVGDIYRVAQQGRVRFGPFFYSFESERRIEVFPGGRIVARALSGSARAMRSEMRLQATGDGGTRIDYRIEMAPAEWVPSSLGVAFMRHEVAEQFNAVVREMLRRHRPAGGN